MCISETAFKWDYEGANTGSFHWLEIEYKIFKRKSKREKGTLDNVIWDKLGLKRKDGNNALNQS